MLIDFNINSIVTTDISCNKIREVINSLNNSSPGHDELSPFVEKTCMEGYIEPISHLVNESLKSCIFPS